MTLPHIEVAQATTHNFQHELGAVPEKIYRKVEKALAILRLDPSNSKRELDVKKLKEIDAWRIKVDDHRVIFQQAGGVQTFHSVLPRKDVYAKLGISDTDGMRLVADIVLPGPLRPGAPAALPHPLTPELLGAWRVRGEPAGVLATCRTEDDLLAAEVPYPVFSKVVDLLYSRLWQDRLGQASYVLARPTDLEDLVEGKLTTQLLRLDDHQRRLSALNLEHAAAPVVVKGGPGSGKSTVALYRAKLLAERYPDARIAYTTYTNALVSASEEQLGALMPDDFGRVRVKTVDGLAYEQLSTVETLGTLLGSGDPLTLHLFEAASEHKAPQLKKFSARYLLSEIFDVIEVNGLESEEAYLASFRAGRKSPLSAALRKQVWKLYLDFTARVDGAKAMTWARLRTRTLAALEAGRLKPIYDHLIVDEAQDLSPISLRMLAGMVRTPGGLYLTADANQTLYESSFSWDALRAGWPEAEHHVLHRNYRNTAELVRGLADVREALNLDDAGAALQEGMKSGPRPRVLVVSEEQELDVLAEEIRRMARDNREPQRNVAILVAGDQKQAMEEGVRLTRELKARKLKANYMSSRGLKLDADCIKIIGMHSSKGLEFPIVVLWNVIEGTLPRDVSDLPSEEQTEEQLKDRRLLYVGCSRAMRQLTIFTRPEQESELLYDLSSDHWDTVSSA